MKLVKKLFGLNANTIATSSSKELNASDIVSIALRKKEPGKQDVDHKIKGLVEDMPYCEELLALVSSPNKYSKAALRNIAQKLDNSELSLEQLRQGLPLLKDQLAVASHSETQQATQILLEPISEEAELAKLCESAQGSQLRQLLLDKISSEALLKQLEKTFKSSDKSSYRLIKSKLDSLKQTEQAKLDHNRKQELFVEDLRQHSSRAYNQDYVFKYESLKRKFSKLFALGLAELNHPLSTDIAGLFEQCENKIAKAKAEHEAAALASAEKIAAAKAETKASDHALSLLEQAENKAGEYSSSATNSKALDELISLTDQLLNEAQLDPQRAEAFAQEFSALNASFESDSENIKETYINLREAIDTLLDALAQDEDLRAAIKNISDDAPASPELKKSLLKVEHAFKPIERCDAYKARWKQTLLANLLARHRETLKLAEAKENEEYRMLTGLIRKAEAAVNEGHLKRAQGIRFSIQEKLEQLNHTPERILRLWTQLEKRVDELGDWQAYAITPKLEKLVLDMEALAKTPKSPELQATQIKKLQSAWKSITKGAGKKHQTLWDQFKAHSDLAYEVCKQHYDKLDEIRQQNTAKRAVLIKQLEDYYKAYNWENADWSKVEKVLSSAKAEWQSYSPALRAEHKAQQNKFSVNLDQIQRELNSWFDKNKSEKQRLINAIAPLSNSEDLSHAIDLAIQLQKQWKTLGRCRRTDDEKLWKSFRAHCDLIFKKRDALREQSRSATDEKIAAAEAILEKIMDIARLDDHSFEKAYRDIDTLKEELSDTQDLPKGKAIAIEKKLRQTIEKAGQRLVQIKNRKQSDNWRLAFKIKSELMSTNDAELELEALPTELKKALRKSVENPALNTNELTEYYRELCIRSEILSGRDTPDSDKAARMALQVKQLQAGLGQRAPSSEDLALEWIATETQLFDEYEPLSSRFLSNLGIFS